MTQNDFDAKVESLRSILRDMGRAIIAYSGGLDSAFLAKVSHEILGDNVLLVIGVSESLPEKELLEARRFAESYGIPLREIRTKELDNPSFSKNPKDRCYHCKSELFGKINEIAKEENIPFVLDGTNKSDEGDYRPGRRAASEMGIQSPLLEAGLTKDDIRSAAKQMNLPIWNKPSFACLASRFPYGESLTKKKLSQVEKCENILRDLHLRQYRVRHHGEIARIEVDEDDIKTVVENRDAVVKGFRDAGYRFVSLDLEGYSTGKMNRGLEEGSQDPKPKKERKPAWMSSWKPRTYGEGWTTLYIDGGSKGNPGPASIAFLMYDHTGKELTRRSELIGEATNNVAEYRALLEGLRAARVLGIEKIVVLSDSQLVVRQVAGQYKIRNPGMMRAVRDVQNVRREFKDFRIQEIGREDNKYADYLVQQAYKS